MQALTHALGGQVEPASEREYGLARLHTLRPNPLIPEGNHQAWMSHGDRIEHIPEGFRPLAKTDNSPVAALADTSRHIYGVQFHPEVKHTTIGEEILRRFVRDICRAEPSWTPASIIEESVQEIRDQVQGSPRAVRRERWCGFQRSHCPGPPGGGRSTAGRVRRHRPAAER